MQWQPIETAPKDTRVIVWDGEEVKISKFFSHFGAWEADGDEYSHGSKPEPTMWMPLPKTPISNV